MSEFSEIYNEDYLYELANIIGSESGLPLTLFFSPKPDNHKIRPIRFKVSPNPQRYKPSDAMDYLIINDGDAISINSVNDKHLKSKNTKVLLQFIILNLETITKFWESELTSTEFGNSLKRI